jgi:multiple sugar transport system permease protein
MFNNYIKLWNDDVFWKSLRNTVIFLTVTVNLSYFIALALSQLLARVSRGQSVMRTLLMIPMMFAPVLVGFQFAWFFNATVGLVNNALMSFGWMTEPKAWLVDQPTGMIAIMLATIWMNVPMLTIILLAGTLSLPQETFEAAKVDGASAWQRFKHITLPLLAPFTLIALTVLSLDIARAYDIVRIMTGGGPAHRTEMIWTYTGRLAIRGSQFGLASAMSMVGVVLGVFFTLYLFRQLIKSRVVY